MKKKMLALCVMSASLYANAEFVMLPNTPDAVPPQASAPNVPKFPVTSAPSGVPSFPNVQQETLAGKNKLPLLNVLKSIMPDGYQGHAEPGMKADYLVEAQITGDFKSDLTNLSRRYNLKFTVDEQKKRLYVSVGEGGFKDATQINNHKGLVTNLPKETQPSAIGPDGRPQLIVMPNKRGEEVLRPFLTALGYSLDWEAATQPHFLNLEPEVYSGTVVDILNDVFVPLGFIPTIYQPENKSVRPTVVVRAAADVIKDMQEAEEAAQ